MKKKTPKQFDISLAGLNAKLLKASVTYQRHVEQLTAEPDNRFAKKNVTTSAKVLTRTKWDLLKFLARDLDIATGTDINGREHYLIPPWQIAWDDDD